MKTNYVTPTIEIVEIEIEDAILAASGDELFGLDGIDDGGNAW